MSEPNAEAWLSDLTLNNVYALFEQHDVDEVLYKFLPKNANSKNQVYLAPDFADLGKIPTGEVTAHESVSQKSGAVEAVFRTPVNLHWLTPTGGLSKAPEAKLIFYPQYPEVRLSGFLRGSPGAPSALYNKEKRGEEDGRVLLLGVRGDGMVVGLTVPPEAPATREIAESQGHDSYGAMAILPPPSRLTKSSFIELMEELCALHRQHWVKSCRLNTNGELVPSNGSNSGGNTLEAHLGIKSNGIALPDFRGWEIKARTVSNIEKPGASIVTLFTPEPTGGAYNDDIERFIRTYGYEDQRGRHDRLNFGGIYSCTKPAHARTNLRMELRGFDVTTGKLEADGAITLVDPVGNEAMSWAFAKLMEHWKTKHSQVVYVPCQRRLEPSRQYRYANRVLAGEGTDFVLFLRAVAKGHIYYDPGIKLENASSTPKPKCRSQIRIKSKDLASLYKSFRLVTSCDPSQATSLFP